jgi:PTH1 family peptidyl-tRNA hydrolase
VGILKKLFKALFTQPPKETSDGQLTNPQPPDMKYLIAGLGNMGADYDNTRHNVGFDVVNALAKEFDTVFKNETLGDLAEFRHKGRIFVLLKPSTYMNRSGKAVRYWLRKKNIDKQNLLVVLDDINLPFGKIRLRGKGSDGGHNGLKDIDQHLGGNDYARLRIGVGSNFPKGRQADFVLSTWSDEELKHLPNILKTASEGVKAFATLGLNFAMNQVNVRA